MKAAALRILLLCLFSLVIATSALAATTYTVTDLGAGAVPNALNNSGQVAGTMTEAGNVAFRYSDGVVSLLTGHGWGNGINDAGDVVGDSFLYHDGQFTNLFDRAGLSGATAINDSGLILGTLGSDTQVLYDPATGSVTEILSSDTGPIGLNNTGEALVDQIHCSDEPGCAASFLFSHGTLTRIVLPHGQAFGVWASDINDRGQVVGRTIQEASPRGLETGFLWQNGVGTILSDTYGPRFIPRGIDNVGRMVGYGRTATRWLPSVYANGSINPVPGALVGTSTAWTIDELHDINDQGQIICSGLTPEGERHGLLLTPVPAIPAAPTGLTAGTLATHQLMLTWKDASDNETSFVVWRSVNGGSYSLINTIPRTGLDTPGTGGAVSYVDGGVTAGATYRYYIRAVNAAGKSDPSNYVTVSFTGALVPPAAPTSLSLEWREGPVAGLSWADNSANETGFTIQRATNTAFTAGVTTFTVGANVTSYADTAVTPPPTFYYRVRATNGAGSSAWSATVATPQTPVFISTPITRATVGRYYHYNVQAVATIPGESLSYSLAALPVGMWINADTGVIMWEPAEGQAPTQLVTVRATDPGGRSGTQSFTINVEPLPADSTGFTAKVTSPGHVTLSWTDNSSNETAFMIWRAEPGTLSSMLATVIRTPAQSAATGGTVTYVDTGMPPGTYYYHLEAINAAGDFTFTGSQALVNTSGVPAPPSGLVAVAQPGPPLNVKLTWADNSSNETGFAIQRARDAAFTSGLTTFTVPAGTTELQDNSVSQATTYYYRVWAFNGLDSAWSNTASATVPNTSNLAPAAPTVLVGYIAAETRVALQWHDSSANETSFVVWRSVNGGAYSLIATITRTAAESNAWGDTVKYSDGGVSGGNTYRYYVRAVNANGKSAPSNYQDITLPDYSTPPAAPGDLAATVWWAVGRVELTWKDNSVNEIGFQVQRATDDGFTGFSTFNVAHDYPYLTDVSFVPGTTYYYRVRAYNGSGYSAFSSTVTAFIPESTPQPPTITSSPLVTATVGVPYSYDVSATDPNPGDTLTYSLTTFPAGMTIDPLTGLITWTPTAAQVPSQAVNVKVIDSLIGTATQSFTIAVTGGTTIPASPTNLSATLSSNQATLRWLDTSTNETNFVVWRSVNGGTYSLIATINRTALESAATGGAVSYANTGLIHGNTYTYYVRAVNPVGKSATSNGVTVKP